MFKHFQPKSIKLDSFHDDSDKCEVIDVINDDGDNSEDENGHEEETSLLMKPFQILPKISKYLNVIYVTLKLKENMS